MALQQSYPGSINSRQTELAGDINDTQTSFEVLDSSVLPAAPNLLTLGTDESAETILYTGKSGNQITGVTRGFEGIAKSWVAGTKLARYFTAYDHETFRQNVSDLDERLNDIPAPEDASLTQKGIVQLSNSTGSDSETEAATPSSVKKAYDAGLAAQAIIKNRDGYGITSNSGNAYSVTLDPAPTGLVAGLRATVMINADNTGAVTLNVNGLGAKSVLKSNGNAMTVNALRTNSVYSLVFNGSDFILQGEGGEYGSAVAGDVRTGKTIGTDNGLVTGSLAERNTTSITPGNNTQSFPSGIYPAFNVGAIPVSTYVVDNTFTQINVPARSKVTIPNGAGIRFGTELKADNQHFTRGQSGGVIGSVMYIGVSGNNFTAECTRDTPYGLSVQTRWGV